jgi:hypothetical protein
MTDSGRGVQDGIAPGAYATQAVLDPGTLAAIREANVSFLGLIARRQAAAPAEPAFGLPALHAAAVARLDAVGRRAVAACPYTLYNLRFEDAAFWRSVALDSDLPGAGSIADDATFARTAAFMAWHLAQSSELTAALVLGMTAPVQEAWRALPLSALDRVATVALPFLAARWGGHAGFWPRLLEAAAPDAVRRAETVRLLGLQLLAADGIRGAAARTPRPLKF